MATDAPFLQVEILFAEYLLEGHDGIVVSRNHQKRFSGIEHATHLGEFLFGMRMRCRSELLEESLRFWCLYERLVLLAFLWGEFDSRARIALCTCGDLLDDGLFLQPALLRASKGITNLHRVRLEHEITEHEGDI